MAEFATNGKGNLGVTLGAIGAGLGVLNGGLGNILGGMGWNNGAMCSENLPVNRYELGLYQDLSAKDSKIALLESNIYVDSKIADVYERLNTKIGCLEGAISQQAVFNATINGTVSCIQGQIAQLAALTKVIIPIENICPAPTA